MQRFSIDDATADRLLTAQLSPDDAPVGVAALAALIEVAAGPATPSELAREASVVASMTTAFTPPPDPFTTSRRQPMISKLSTAKFAGLAVVGALGLGTAAAAATGSLPGQSSHASSQAPSGLTTAPPQDSAPNTSTSSTSEVTTATPAPTLSTSIPATGPANVHAQFGLCTAFLAGNPTTSGSTTSLPPQDSSTAFKALINQNGGVAATVIYCTGVVNAGPPASTGAPDATGTPPDTGKSGNSGKPVAAGQSESHVPAGIPESGSTASGNAHGSGASSPAQGKVGGH